MTTRYVITLADESTATVDPDRVDVVDGGALVFAVADEPPPAGMREVFLLAPRSWRWCQAADAGVSWSNATWGGQQGEQKPPPRLLPATSHPERAGW
jgi:hypothetical protein